VNVTNAGATSTVSSVPPLTISTQVRRHRWDAARHRFDHAGRSLPLSHARRRTLRINRFRQCVAMLKEKKSHTATAAASGPSLDLAHRCLG